MKKVWSVLLVLALVAGLVGCGSKGSAGGNKEVDLNAVLEDVKTAYGDSYSPNMDIDADTLSSLYGITSDMTEEVVAQMPMIGFDISRFIAIKAKDGQADAVETALNAYRDAQINDAMQYPINAVKIQASQVIRQGNYVFFVLLGQLAPEDEEKSDEEVLNLMKEQNQIGVDVINGYFQ